MDTHKETNVLSGSNLDSERLADVLCRTGIADEPIAVIGIVGPARSGKSFILSYLSRYLKLKGWCNSNWIGDDERSLHDGFSWRGGKRAHTNGMRICNEVFNVPWKNGQGLNVLLVDTQGLFGPGMTKEDNTKLFTLAMTICSDLILNVEKRMDERDLETVELSARYGVNVIDRGDSTKNEISPSFQNLTIVVRDWPYPQDNQFGAVGGGLYIHEFFDKTSKSEGNSVRQNIRSTFKKLNGFLMPYPGHKVEEPDFTGKNRNLSKGFLNSVDELAHILFDSRRLEPRLSHGVPITGRNLYKLMEACEKTFHDGSVPRVLNMFSALAKLKAMTASGNAFKRFEMKMEETSNTCGNLEASYDTIIKECLLDYDSNTTFCGEAVNEEYRELLILKCQEVISKLCAWSDFRKRQAHNYSLQVLHSALIMYKKNMKEGMGLNDTPDIELKELYKRNLRKALQLYRDEVTPRTAFTIDHLQTLKDLINNSFTKYQKINARRSGLVILSTMDDMVGEYEAQIFVNYVTDNFREELEEFSHLFIDERELQKQIENLQSKFLSIFDNKWMTRWPNIQTYKQDLLDVMESEYNDCMECNSRNKDVFQNIIEESLSKAKVIYHDVINQVIEKGYCEPAELKKAHVEVRKDVIGQLKSELGDIDNSLARDVFDQIDSYTESEFLKCCQINDGNAKNTADRRPEFNINDLLKRAHCIVTEATTLIRKVVTIVEISLKTAKLFSGSPAATSIGVALATISWPKVIIVAAAGVGICAIGYCVYKLYQYRKRKVGSMITK